MISIAPEKSVSRRSASASTAADRFSPRRSARRKSIPVRLARVPRSPSVSIHTLWSANIVATSWPSSSIPRVRAAPDKFARSIRASSSNAPSSEASVRLASARLARFRIAPSSCAPSRLAPIRLAPSRLHPVISARPRSAPAKLLPRISASRKSARPRFALPPRAPCNRLPISCVVPASVCALSRCATNSPPCCAINAPSRRSTPDKSA